MKIAIIVNPTAGQYSEKIILKLLKRLREENKIVYYFSTCYKEHIIELIKLIKQLRIKKIILAGGDGTINSALSELIFSQLKILILPLGTANVLHKTLNITLDIDNIIEILKNDKLIYLNVGRIKRKDNTKYFALMASVGLDASAIKLIDENLKIKRIIGKFAYLIYYFYVFFIMSLKKIVIMTDIKKEVLTNQLIISNINFYAGEYLLLPREEKIFNVFKVFKSNLNKKNFIFLILDFLLKKNFYKIFKYLKDTEKIKILTEDLPIQIDGDFLGYTPCQVSIIKKCVIFYHNL